jgi:hypothetical protein
MDRLFLIRNYCHTMRIEGSMYGQSTRLRKRNPIAFAIRGRSGGKGLCRKIAVVNFSKNQITSYFVH